MRPTDIRVGATYANRTGTRTRTVLAIGDKYHPEWYRDQRCPRGNPGLEFRAGNGAVNRVYLSSFARWASKEVLVRVG